MEEEGLLALVHVINLGKKQDVALVLTIAVILVSFSTFWEAGNDLLEWVYHEQLYTEIPKRHWRKSNRGIC